MTDITMCKGQDCLLRESCYRYTAPANPYRQSYFLTEPLDEIGDCKEWVDNGKELIDDEQCERAMKETDHANT